nr:unnamed protein product [Spirometra erinaceieuropaei]
MSLPSAIMTTPGVFGPGPVTFTFTASGYRLAGLQPLGRTESQLSDTSTVSSDDVRRALHCKLHGGMMARVADNGTVSDAFTLTKGVKQGCVLAPNLLSLVFSVMLIDAYRDERRRISIIRKTDDHLSNTRYRLLPTRPSKDIVQGLHSVDD